MHNYGIKQPVVCCIMRSQDSTLTGLLSLESFGSLIRILNLLISTDRLLQCFQECVSLSEESFLGRMPWVQIQAYHFPGYTNVLTNSLFMRVRMIQIECVLNDF